MELMYPIVIVISLIISIAVILLFNSKKEKYTKGKKIANTKYVKETKYYEEMLQKYKMILSAVKVVYLICIVLMSVLVARPVTIVTKSEDKYSRDVILDIDLSGSENDVNLDLVSKFKKMIPEIEGDRIGIVVFNTAPIVYCPLTTDYDYLYERLDTLKKCLEEDIKYNQKLTKDMSPETQALFFGGVVANNMSRGSSLIGDGLAGGIFAFPDYKTDKERTRILVFATDNDVSGTETVSLEDAAQICKKYDIKLYAYCPTESMNQYVTAEKTAKYKQAITNAGGKFYTGDLSSSTQSIVDEIKTTKQTATNTAKKTYITDHPEKFFILFVAGYMALIVLEQRIKL